MENCPHCGRALAGEICILHGFVGKKTDEEFGRVPIGGIIMYSGSATLLPSGWKLCDGTFGTPDLRDKFILGAGNSYAVGGTGGSNAAHSHSLSVSGTSGSGTSHSHTVTPADHASVDTQTQTLSHTHTYGSVTNDDGEAGNAFNPGTQTPTITRAAVAHTHSFSGTTGQASSTSHAHTINAYSHSQATSSSEASHTHTTGGTGTSGTASSMPAYYALAFIMRLT
jgi:hypothetical protein